MLLPLFCTIVNSATPPHKRQETAFPATNIPKTNKFVIIPNVKTEQEKTE